MAGKGIDIDKVIKKAYAEDERFGAMLEAGRYFGLRTKESVLLNPKKALVQGRRSDPCRRRDEGWLSARGCIFGISDQQRVLSVSLRLLRWVVASALTWPGLTWKQAQSKFYWLPGRSR